MDENHFYRFLMFSGGTIWTFADVLMTVKFGHDEHRRFKPKAVGLKKTLPKTEKMKPENLKKLVEIIPEKFSRFSDYSKI